MRRMFARCRDRACSNRLSATPLTMRVHDPSTHPRTQAETQSVVHADFPDACHNWAETLSGCPTHAPPLAGVRKRSDVPRGRVQVPGRHPCIAQCRVHVVPAFSGENGAHPGIFGDVLQADLGGGYAGENWTAWEGRGAEAWGDAVVRRRLARTCYVAIGKCALRLPPFHHRNSSLSALVPCLLPCPATGALLSCFSPAAASFCARPQLITQSYPNHHPIMSQSSHRYGMLDASRAACFYEMRPEDVVLASMGLHFNEAGELEEEARCALCVCVLCVVCCVPFAPAASGGGLGVGACGWVGASADCVRKAESRVGQSTPTHSPYPFATPSPLPLDPAPTSYPCPLKRMSACPPPWRAPPTAQVERFLRFWEATARDEGEGRLPKLIW